MFLRGGGYGQLAPTNSGQPGNPITIAGYPGETASIDNLAHSPAIYVIGQSDLVFRNLQTNNDQGFGRIQDSTRIVFENMTFKNATDIGTTAALKFVRSTYSKVLNSTFTYSEEDTLLFQDSADYNLVEGNSFDTALHSQISIRCANFNVVRNNTFSNPEEKAIEIFDCEAVSDAPYLLDATKRNLFEGNLFTFTRAASASYLYNAIQHGAQYTIVRDNVVRDCLGGGFNYQHYSDESLYVYGNRMYNNTFYNNACYGVIGASGPSSEFYDNRITNNLLYKNTSCSGSNQQTSIANSSEVIMTSNVLATSDPGFTNEASNDFHLTSSSPNIDAGTFLTKTTTAGSGTVMPVDDASYFYDGYGIDGESGDAIQLEGDTTVVHVVGINYQTNELTLDGPLTWSTGQGVSLQYSGSAPDVGAFEYSSNSTRSPATPTSLRATGLSE